MTGRNRFALVGWSSRRAGILPAQRWQAEPNAKSVLSRLCRAELPSLRIRGPSRAAISRQDAGATNRRSYECQKIPRRCIALANHQLARQARDEFDCAWYNLRRQQP